MILDASIVLVFLFDGHSKSQTVLLLPETRRYRRSQWPLFWTLGCFHQGLGQVNLDHYRVDLTCMSHICTNFSSEATSFKLSIDEVRGSRIYMFIKLLTEYFAKKVNVWSKFSKGTYFEKYVFATRFIEMKALKQGCANKRTSLGDDSEEEKILWEKLQSFLWNN